MFDVDHSTNPLSLAELTAPSFGLHDDAWAVSPRDYLEAALREIRGTDQNFYPAGCGDGLIELNVLSQTGSARITRGMERLAIVVDVARWIVGGKLRVPLATMCEFGLVLEEIAYGDGAADIEKLRDLIFDRWEEVLSTHGSMKQ